MINSSCNSLSGVTTIANAHHPQHQLWRHGPAGVPQNHLPEHHQGKKEDSFILVDWRFIRQAPRVGGEVQDMEEL